MQVWSLRGMGVCSGRRAEARMRGTRVCRLTILVTHSYPEPHLTEIQRLGRLISARSQRARYRKLYSPHMTERSEASPAVPGSSSGTLPPPHSEPSPHSPSTMLRDVAGAPLRGRQLCIVLGSPEQPEFHGVVAHFGGLRTSAFGHLAKVTIFRGDPVRSGSDIERASVPPSMLLDCL